MVEEGLEETRSWRKFVMTGCKGWSGGVAAAGRCLEQMVQPEMLSLHQLLSLKQKKGPVPLWSLALGRLSLDHWSIERMG